MYKLEKYEHEMTALFKNLSFTIDVGKEIVNYYEKVKPVDLTSSFLYSLYLYVMRRTNFALYDKMLEEFPDFTLKNLHTLLRNSFYAAFHRTVCEMYDSEKASQSYNIRDF